MRITTVARALIFLAITILSVPTSANTFSDPNGTLAHRALAGSMPSPNHCTVNASRYARNPLADPKDPTCYLNPLNNKWYQETDPVKREAIIVRLYGESKNNDCRRTDTGSFQSDNRVVFRSCDDVDTAKEAAKPNQTVRRGYTVNPNDPTQYGLK